MFWKQLSRPFRLLAGFLVTSLYFAALFFIITIFVMVLAYACLPEDWAEWMKVVVAFVGGPLAVGAAFLLYSTVAQCLGFPRAVSARRDEAAGASVDNVTGHEDPHEP